LLLLIQVVGVRTIAKCHWVSIPDVTGSACRSLLIEAAFALNRHIVASTSFAQVSALNVSLATRGPLGHMAPHAPLSHFDFQVSFVFNFIAATTSIDFSDASFILYLIFVNYLINRNQTRTC
jgi:hypothetical protein